jgi:two-component system, OmpR family, sensor histidine kinase KdpD
MARAPRSGPGIRSGSVRGSGIGGWTTQLGAATLRRQRPQRSTGIVAAVLSVAIATLAIYFLRKIAPVVSLSVVYLPAVLLVATYWGLALGLLTSLLSAAAFNWFHIPPTGEFTIVDGRNWVALAAFMIVALFASALAELARSRAQEAERRRAEADLAAALAHELLLGEDTQAALASAARRVAEALELTSAAIEPGPALPTTADPRRTALALRGIDGEQMATLLVPANLPPDTEQRLRTQVVPTLEALVAIAQRRDAMQAELVETAALRRSDDIKTALLRAVSHDLRTPLTAVVAAGHALGADSLTDQERSELSAAVVEEGTRLAGLVDNLLALSRLQAGSATPRSDWVSIEDLVSAAAEGLRGWAGGEAVSVRVTIDPDVPEVRADAAQLERAFANLLENAGRYGGGSPVFVHARRGGGPAGEGVLVSVTDQGPGIDAVEQERIFEPFYRGRSSRSAAWTGSGLGLAIVKGFVEANGGSITVQSLPGQGTTFYVLLPVTEREPSEVGAGTAERTP